MELWGWKIDSDTVRDATGVLAALTSVFAWRAARASAKAAWVAAEASINAERAHVALSHEPPGIKLVRPDRIILPRIQIQNSGNTPADIRAISLRFWIETELPKRPPYALGEGQAFRVAKEDANSFQPPDEVVSAETLDEVVNGVQGGWLLGYVDYATFGRTYRAGYARKYTPQRDDNNLIIESRHGYNYEYRKTLWSWLRSLVAPVP